jgi:hypothetical protein
MTDNPRSNTDGPAVSAPGISERQVPFGSNEVRLAPWEWPLVVLLVWLVPVVWGRFEPLPPGPDARMPYALGEDYWLFGRWCRAMAASGKTLVLGDSVVWGHYVEGGQTLSAHLNRLSGEEAFANLGVDGIHPAAMAGLVEHYAGSIRARSVLLHCNPLWLSSPTHDLRGDKEFAFQHPRLVPQFSPWIGCYKESLEGRLGNVLQRNVPLLSWASHLRIAYFGGSDLAPWTVEHPGENPFRQLALELPLSGPSPESDPKPWTRRDIKPYGPPWVDLEGSLQWASFRRTMALLRSRGNRVFVVVGPFNEHMLKPESRAAYRTLKAEIGRWLAEEGIPHLVPEVLPSELYADASHPLDDGYAALAGRLMKSEPFARFLSGD